jgi:hypothetical protein
VLGFILEASQTSFNVVSLSPYLRQTDQKSERRQTDFFEELQLLETLHGAKDRQFAKNFLTKANPVRTDYGPLESICNT